MPDIPQEGAAPVVSCYTNFLATEFVKQVDKQGVTHRVAQFTICMRKFLSGRPVEGCSPIDAMKHRAPECSKCCIELTTFRRSFRMLMGQTKLDYCKKIEEFWETMCRAQSPMFVYEKDWKEKYANMRILPNPGVPVFNNYNPDQFVEAKKRDDEELCF